MNFDYNTEKIEELLKDFNLKADFNLALALAKKIRCYYVYNTAALEGNTMTYPEVQTLLEGITVGGHKLSEEQQILNQNESWELLMKIIKEKEFKITKEIFCKLHEKVAKEEALEWGKFRTQMVNIGGTSHKPPQAEKLEDIFLNGINTISKTEHPLLQALLFFLFGANSKFFFDGNKRTSRLMMNGILLKNGYPILNILAKDKLEFNTKMIEFYDTQNATNILEFLIKYYLKQNEDFVKK